MSLKSVKSLTKTAIFQKSAKNASLQRTPLSLYVGHVCATLMVFPGFFTKKPPQKVMQKDREKCFKKHSENLPKKRSENKRKNAPERAQLKPAQMPVRLSFPRVLCAPQRSREHGCACSHGSGRAPPRGSPRTRGCPEIAPPAPCRPGNCPLAAVTPQQQISPLQAFQTPRPRAAPETPKPLPKVRDSVQ